MTLALMPSLQVLGVASKMMAKNYGCHSYLPHTHTNKLEMETPRPDVSHYSLLYDSPYQEDSSHTGEISKQVACNPACV